MAEQRADIRQADLVLGGTDLLLGTLKDKGFLQPIRPVLMLPEVLDTSAWFRRKLWFADTEDKFVARWRAVPYTAALSKQEASGSGLAMRHLMGQRTERHGAPLRLRFII
jgi:hypothetical protein